MTADSLRAFHSTDPDGRRVLGLFAKQPLPGRVKTRLASVTTDTWAASVAEAFLRDMIERLSTIGGRRILAFAPVCAEPYFRDLVRDRFALVSQGDGDLGQRMAAFISARLREGAEKVVLLGTDSPTVPLGFIEQAFQELEQADVVLGPATDGGYYLIGCSRRLPPLFEGITWSSAFVLGETISRLADPSWRLALLPPWYDIDTLDDWRMLQGHLAALRKTRRPVDVPHTSALASP